MSTPDSGTLSRKQSVVTFNLTPSVVDISRSPSRSPSVVSANASPTRTPSISERAAGDTGPPKDKWHLIYCTLVLHGIGVLTAWNMFITAKDYFVEYKLKGTAYADNFLVYVGYAAQLPNLIFSWLNVFVEIGGDLTTRIVVALGFEILVFVLTVILAMVDSSAWPAAFFWITMIAVFKINAWNAIFQNCVYGVAGRLPPRYTGAVVLGSNTVGTLVVLLSWATSSAGDLKVAAIYYFIGGMFVIIVCLDSYIALPINKFYRYYEKPSTRGKPEPTPYRDIIAVCWVQLYNVFMSYFVSLSIFPAVHSDIFSVSNPKRAKGEGFLGDNFVRFTCFLTFNVTAMLGNVTANFFPYPTRNWLAIFTTVRLIFIPLFLMCNYHPRNAVRTMGVVLKSDAVYWSLAVLLGWSLGHCGGLAMMYVGGNVKEEHATKAGMMAGAILVTGILVGITFSGICPFIVTWSVWK